MKKYISLILTFLMLMSCPAASAQTIYTELDVDRDGAKRILTSFGMDETQAGLADSALALVSALGATVTTLEDGAQLDLDLKGNNAVSFGCAADDQGITLVSTLFPNYAVTVPKEMLSQVMEGFSGSLPGSGTGGMSMADMGAMTEAFGEYFSRFLTACSQAAVTGEPVTGEYVIGEYVFDVMVPVTVDIPAVSEALQGLFDEMMADETIQSAIRLGMQYSGSEFKEEELRAAFEGWRAHFPDEASAEYYTESDGSKTFYITGQSSYAGREDPSYAYTLLYDADSMAMTLDGYEEPGMEMMFEYSGGSMSASCSIAGMYYGFNFLNEGSRYLCELFFMEKETPLFSVSVTMKEGGERTLAVDTDGKTVVSAQEVTGGSEAAGGLMNDMMTNGLGSLVTTVVGAVPEAGGLISILMGASPEEYGPMNVQESQSVQENRLLQLGNSFYTIEIPASFTEGERTEEDIRDDMIAYYYSPETLLNFDIYEFSKEGYPEELASFTEQEAAEYEAFEIVTDGKINGIDAAWYRARETYDDKEYETLTYVLDGGLEYVEITFWLDGDEARIQEDEIMSSLTFITR